MRSLINVASESSFGLGGKIIQGFKAESRNGQSYVSEMGPLSFNKSVMSLSGYTNGTNFGFVGTGLLNNLKRQSSQ